MTTPAIIPPAGWTTRTKVIAAVVVVAVVAGIALAFPATREAIGGLIALLFGGAIVHRTKTNANARRKVADNAAAAAEHARQLKARDDDREARAAERRAADAAAKAAAARLVAPPPLEGLTPEQEAEGARLKALWAKPL